MKYTITIFLAAITVSVSAQNFNLTSSVNAPYNQYGSAVYDTTIYHYATGQSKPDTATTLNWSLSNQQWVNYRRYYKTYSATNKPIIEAQQNWNNSTLQWDNVRKDSSAYNSLDSILTWTTQGFSTTTGWTTLAMLTYTYDMNNDLVTIVGQSLSNNTWTNYYRTTFSYSLQHQPLAEVHQLWDINNVTWRENYKYDISYNGSNTIRVAYYYNSNGAYFILYDRETYTLNGNDTTAILYELPQSGTWVNSERKTFTYSGGRITNKTLQAYNVSSYINESKIDYAYNSNNLLTSITPMTWTNGSWQAANTDTTKRYYYSPMQPNNISNIAGQNELAIWPQPANNFILIDAKGDAELLLLNMSGKIAKKATGSRIETANIPSGVYLLKIQQGQNLTCKRAVIQH